MISRQTENLHCITKQALKLAFQYGKENGVFIPENLV
jgi:hypothetical protein